MVHFGDFLKIETSGQTVLPDRPIKNLNLGASFQKLLNVSFVKI